MKNNIETENEDNNCNTGLLWACMLNNVDIVKILIKEKVNINHRNKQNENGYELLSHEAKIKLEKCFIEYKKKDNLQI